MDNNYSERDVSFLQKRILELEAEVNRVCPWTRDIDGWHRSGCPDGKVYNSRFVTDYCQYCGGKVVLDNA